MNAPKHAEYDVIVCGGGPSGSTVANLLAQRGRRVLQLDKDVMPRHHIGESLMPATYHVFKRLGVLDELRRSDFPVKESVQFSNAEGKDSAPFFFTDFDPAEHSKTWQVRRADFDRMMINKAREMGAEVIEGARVTRVLFEGEGAAARAVGVEVKINDRLHEVRSRVVVDATGVNALLSKQLNLRGPDPKLKNAAFYSYFRNAIRGEGRNAGATLVIDTPEKNGWFWFIPISDDVTSIGVVAPPSYLCTGRGSDPDQVLKEEIARTPGISKRLVGAEQVDVTRVISDFSYRASRMAGNGWVLVGDAFCFLDPVYSTGLLLALRGGEWAADAIDAALADGDLSGERLGTWGDEFNKGVHRLRMFVYAFYDPNFRVGAFVKAHPEHRDNITRLLIGDVFNEEVGSVFTPMRQWTTLPEMIPLEREASIA